MPPSVRIAAALTACAAAACARDTTGPEAGGGCARNAVTLTVSAGPRPTFTWTPACRVASLTVTEQTAAGRDGQTVWVLSDVSRAQTGIAPPAQYPETVRGAALGDADPLVAGRRYRVSLGAMTAPDRCPGFLVVCPRNVAGETFFEP